MIGKNATPAPNKKEGEPSLLLFLLVLLRFLGFLPLRIVTFGHSGSNYEF
ncbi:MAG: hypothetical protein V1738_00120 [Patescibacteria group bacterium]